jgi:hypothetical protein
MSPDQYTWPVHGAEVCIFGDGTTKLETLHELAILLIQFGAAMVIIVKPGFVPMPVYRPARIAR